MDIMSYYAPIQAQQSLNNAWSAEQAQKAMEYQTYMSNSAHQREVEDLKKAGLNPVLSAGGQGASTTSGVAATAGQENVTALYGLMSKALQANIDQAQALQNTAKYISGAGSSRSISVVDKAGSQSKSRNAVVGDGRVDFDNAFFDASFGALKDVLKRKFGIQPETVDKLVDSSGVESLDFSEKSFKDDMNLARRAFFTGDLEQARDALLEANEGDSRRQSNVNKLFDVLEFFDKADDLLSAKSVGSKVVGYTLKGKVNDIVEKLKKKF